GRAGCVGWGVLGFVPGGPTHPEQDQLEPAHVIVMDQEHHAEKTDGRDDQITSSSRRSLSLNLRISSCLFASSVSGIMTSSSASSHARSPRRIPRGTQYRPTCCFDCLAALHMK